jgi:hypothetical protein
MDENRACARCVADDGGPRLTVPAVSVIYFPSKSRSCVGRVSSTVWRLTSTTVSRPVQRDDRLYPVDGRSRAAGVATRSWPATSGTAPPRTPGSSTSASTEPARLVAWRSTATTARHSPDQCGIGRGDLRPLRAAVPVRWVSRQGAWMLRWRQTTHRPASNTPERAARAARTRSPRPRRPAHGRLPAVRAPAVVVERARVEREGLLDELETHRADLGAESSRAVWRRVRAPKPPGQRMPVHRHQPQAESADEKPSSTQRSGLDPT